MTDKRFVAAFVMLFFCLAATGQKKVYDRGYDLEKPSAVIAPKGAWLLGGNIGIGTSTQDNYDFLVINGINSKSRSLVASPQFCYMFAQNMGIGGRFKYTRSYLDLQSASASFGKTDITIKNYNYLNHKYMGAVFFRYYYPFGASGRFAAYVDAELGAGGSESKVQDAHSVDVKASFDKGFNASVGANVGLLALLTPHLGVDVRVGLLEFNYNSSKQLHNQVKEGSAKFVGGNFVIDLLAISFGVSYYL